MRCLTQWRHLKALKRSGRGHDPSGAEGTVDGGLAILCPSCPHPGINLPSRWREQPAEKQYVRVRCSCRSICEILMSNISQVLVLKARMHGC